MAPSAWPWITASVGGVAAAMAGLQVGRGRDLAVLALVGAVCIVALSVVRPYWLVTLGASFVFAGAFSIGGIPIPELGAGLVILGTAFTPASRWRIPRSLVLLVALVLIWVVFTATADIADPLVGKRLLSLLLWTMLVAAVALRESVRTCVAWGLLVGLMVSAPAGAVIGSGYGARWAGFVGDPNSFSMVAAISTPLIVGQLRMNRWQSASVWILSATLIAFADSRTGMAALATAAVVFWLLPILRLWTAAIPLSVLVVQRSLPDDLVRGGRWADRVGSDELRREIDAASLRQIADSPWTGHGLGQGRVDLSLYGDPPRDLLFFLHNSYNALITEMGVIGLCLYGVLALGAVVQGARGTLARGALAAIAAATVMASQLGEVLFAIPVALAFGFAWGSNVRPEKESPKRGSATMRSALGLRKHAAADL